MELCNRSYGFFDIPSLFVFVNPFSPRAAVRRAMDESVEEVLPALDAEERADLLQRFATFLHEHRHFHDVISTPFGNRLFRVYLAYAVLCASVFTRRRWNGPQLAVPLRPPDVAPDDLAVVEAKRQQILGLLEVARPAFELSAMMVQVQAAWSLLGAEAANVTIEDLLANSKDRDLLEGAILWNEEAGYRDRLLRAVAKTVLGVGLGWADAPAESTGQMLRRALHRLQEIASPVTGTAVTRIELAAEGAWRELLINLDSADEANKRLVANVEEKLADWPNGVTETLVSVAQGFADEARRCHAIAREEPERLVDGGEYLRRAKELPQPRLYYFSDDDKLCAFDEPLPLDRLPLAWQTEYTLENGTKKYCHRLFPAEWLGEPSREIPGGWEDYAKAVVGPTALFEPVNWNHPFRAYCLRTIGRLTGVRVVRRMV